MDNFEIADKEIWADEELTVVVLLPEINVVDEIESVDGSQQGTKLVVTLLK